MDHQQSLPQLHADAMDVDFMDGITRGMAEAYIQGVSEGIRKSKEQGQKWKVLYQYYIVMREGMCPGEFHGDIREIVNREGNYTLKHLPLTQGFALDNLYTNVENFKAPGKDDDRTMLKSDPYWTSEDAWAYLGRWAEASARVPDLERKAWFAEEQDRHERIRQNLIRQYLDQKESAPSLVQLANFSTIHTKLTSRFESIDGWADGADVERIWQNILHAGRHPAGAMLDPEYGFPQRTPTNSRAVSRSVEPESSGTPPAPNYTDWAEYMSEKTASALGEKLVHASVFRRRHMALAQHSKLKAYINQLVESGKVVARHAKNFDPTPLRDPFYPTDPHSPKTSHHLPDESSERAGSPTSDRLLSLMNLGYDGKMISIEEGREQYW
ncbi:uncharacterized protein PAC_17681 [Phialocephala subalpina]|uniref:Uncharacterized protein n=1 Tax=Phialocephala subalpina TaxID=576137 RepID=A0A1L7XRT9_9HELO|nr:uncharacterized protein PAC_17681 [Phialocephala subalpina]